MALESSNQTRSVVSSRGVSACTSNELPALNGFDESVDGRLSHSPLSMTGNDNHPVASSFYIAMSRNTSTVFSQHRSA